MIADEVVEAARAGATVAEAAAHGAALLTDDDVLPGVRTLLGSVQVEAFFEDGQKLVTVHDAIGPGTRTPTNSPSSQARSCPQKAISSSTPAGPTATVTVENTGDRPIQVGSHFHFFETNRALRFDRAAAFGMRLDIPSGTAVRFEPGEAQDVSLTAYGGERTVVRPERCHQRPDDGAAHGELMSGMHALGFLDARAPEMAHRISRRRYAELYGPTTGDRVRLADTELLAKVEHDATVYGDEACSAAVRPCARAWRCTATSPMPTAHWTSSSPTR